MSESRITNPATPSKPARARKRPAKAKATAAQPEVPRPSEAVTKPTVPIRLSATERELMIRMAAYYRAQQRRFEPGHEVEDWLAAEAEIDRVLLEGEVQS